MPFSVNDLQDLLRVLQERPEWRAELRRQVLLDELLDLPAAVHRLAEAQERTQEQLGTLTARVDRLAQAQERTQEQLAALVGRVDGQERGQQRLRHDVGALAEFVGASAEAQARPVLMGLLQARGYRLLDRPRPIAVDGEVDVATRVQDPAGNELWVLLEARARLRRGDVQGWHRRLQDQAFLARLRAAGVTPPFLVYAFGLQVYADAEAAARDAGIGILVQEGEVVGPTPRSA